MSIHPTLRYADAAGALEFLTTALGFRLGHVTRDDDGVVRHAELSFGGGGPAGVLMVGTRDGGSWDTGRAVTYLVVEDADAHHATAVAAGARVVAPLTDQPYGSREYAVEDPEGNAWSIGTYRPDPT